MTKNLLKIIIFLIPFLFSSFLVVLAQPTEKTLIESWEDIQRNDPKTIVFEKIEERRYKFKTERFPFDGELKILNITNMDNFDYKSTVGFVELELVDLPDDFFQKYSYSYSAWTENNILYYNQETENWLSSKEYNTEMQKNMNNQEFFMNFKNLFIVFILIIFIILMLVKVKNINKKNTKYIKDAQDLMDKSLKISQKSMTISAKSNKILKEILKELKNYNKKL